MEMREVIRRLQAGEPIAFAVDVVGAEVEEVVAARRLSSSILAISTLPVPSLAAEESKPERRPYTQPR